MEETQTIFLFTVGCVQFFRLMLYQLPWYPGMVFFWELCHPSFIRLSKFPFFFSLTAIQIPSPRAFAGSSFTLHSLWGSLASATSEDSQICILNQSLSSELRNQQHICLLDISAWTTHFAQSVCPLLTKLSVFFFLCSLDHQTTASSQHQALGFSFQPCF